MNEGIGHAWIAGIFIATTRLSISILITDSRNRIKEPGSFGSTFSNNNNPKEIRKREG